MMPGPELTDALRELSLRMVGDERPLTDGDRPTVPVPSGELLPLDVDHHGRVAATLIAYLPPSMATATFITGLLRERSGWRVGVPASQVSNQDRPAGNVIRASSDSQNLVSSGVMPWSGSYLCTRHLLAGPGITRLQIARRERVVPGHGQMIVAWLSRQRIVQWGPGLSVDAGPGRAPRMVAIGRDGTEQPVLGTEDRQRRR